MDERDFNNEISVAWSVLKETLKIGRSLIWGRSLPIDEVFRDIALSPESSYDLIFRTALSRSHYNVLVEDYAYFQFSWFNDTSWRLGFFPNPWITGVSVAEPQRKRWELLEEIGVLSHEEVSELIAEMPYFGNVPPVRFEYAPGQYRELTHPAAHFHIGRHDENRWPMLSLDWAKGICVDYYKIILSGCMVSLQQIARRGRSRLHRRCASSRDGECSGSARIFS